MKPFVNPLAQLSAALGAANSLLVGKFANIESIKPAEAGSVFERRNCNSHGLVSATGYRGLVDTGYNRIDMSVLMGAVGKQDIAIRTRQKPTSTHGALALMNRKWKFEINKDSVLDLPIAYAGDGVGTVTVQFKDGVPEAYGTFQFKLAPGPDNVATLNLNYYLGYGLYPNGRNDIGQAQFLSYPIDCSAENAYLGSLWKGQPIDTLLVDKVSALTGITWISNAPGAYSLQDAKVTYVGPVRPGIDVPKDPFTQIATIELGSSCTNFAGELTFYFNPN